MAKSTEVTAPRVEASVGYKTTTVRLRQALSDEVQLFADATNESLTEFIAAAAAERVARLRKDPKVKKGVERQLRRQQARIQKVLDAFDAPSTNGDGDDEVDDE